jgi:hypothetical protein
MAIEEGNHPVVQQISRCDRRLAIVGHRCQIKFWLMHMVEERLFAHPRDLLTRLDLVFMEWRRPR